MKDASGKLWGMPVTISAATTRMMETPSPSRIPAKIEGIALGSSTMRTFGRPSASAVARAMAVGSLSSFAVASAIQEGAEAFVRRQYRTIAIIAAVTAAAVVVVLAAMAGVTAFETRDRGADVESAISTSLYPTSTRTSA